jgi:hypothetical protein
VSAGRLLDALTAVAEPVEVSFLWRPSLRDPDNVMVPETAVNGRADWLLTFNAADFAGAARFGVSVGRPSAVWRETEGLRGGARG